MDALFSTEDADNKPQPSIDDSSHSLFVTDKMDSAISPLFDDSADTGLFKDQSVTTLKASPLFASEDARTPPDQKKSVAPAPLFDPNEPVGISPVHVDTLQPQALFDPSEPALIATEKTGSPEPQVLFDPNEPAPSPISTPQVKAAFDVPEDPLVDQVMVRILAEYPDRAAEDRALRNKMSGLFPVDFDKFTDFGESALLKQRAFVSESKRAVDLHQSLNVQEQMAEIIQAAQGAQKAPASFIGKLRKEIVARTSHVSGSAEWHAVLHRLRGSLKLVSSEIPAILSAGEDSLAQIAQYAVILKAVVPSIQDASINDAGARRLTLILGALQQIQIALKQLQQAQTLLRTEIQQIDETITVTLPALGFNI